MDETPPAEIEARLRWEARYVDVAVAVHDDCTRDYADMCLKAADEIAKLRRRVAELESSN